MQRLFRVTGSVISLLSILGVVGAIQASALTYDGTDPGSTGCSNTAFSPTSKQVDYGTLEERFSTHCNTAWARFTCSNRADARTSSSGCSGCKMAPSTRSTRRGRRASAMAVKSGLPSCMTDLATRHMFASSDTSADRSSAITFTSSGFPGNAWS